MTLGIIRVASCRRGRNAKQDPIADLFWPREALKRFQSMALAKERRRQPRATEWFNLEHFTGRFPEAVAFAAYRLGGKNPYPGAFDARIILFSAALLPSSRA